MDDHSLERLLEEAAQSTALSLSKPIPNLADRVRLRARQRRRRRRQLGAAAVAACLVAVVVYGVGPWSQDKGAEVAQPESVTKTTPKAVDVVALQEELVELRAKLAQLETELKCYREVEARGLARRQPPRAPRWPSPELAADLEIEKTAFILVHLVGDRTNAPSGADPLAGCRQVVKYFPDTSSAQVARKRLAEHATQLNDSPEKQGDI
ncbi:MAG: hypothetical protein JW818_12230 [Pirellulales bacterium]|nr:hypothetical protein [Pirellulales bacterium]